MILYSESKGWLFSSTTRHDSPGPARGTPVAQTGDTFGVGCPEVVSIVHKVGPY